MNSWVEIYIVGFILSVILGAIILPEIIRISYQKKLFDAHDERKIHKGDVPRLGGLSFFPVMMFSLCMVTGFIIGFDDLIPEVGFILISRKLLFLCCAMMLMYFVGIADDLVGVRYLAKFLFQIIAASLLVVSGVWIESFYGFLWIEDLPPYIGYILSLVAIIYVINAINLIDGIDGLASGLSIIALFFYSWIFFVNGEYFYAVISGTMLGALVPFFFFNVFGTTYKRTKVFMGDTGTLTVGLILAFIALKVLGGYDVDYPALKNPMVMALSPLMMPFFDVVRVFFRRLLKGGNPFMPDMTHIHHKLLMLGLRQSQVLVAILAMDLVLIIINVLMDWVLQPTWIILIDILILTLMNLGVTRGIRARERKLGKKLYI